MARDSKLVDAQNIRQTPTGMAPSSQPFFVVHAGHQTILDSRNPLARWKLGEIADHTADPIKEREFRLRVRPAGDEGDQQHDDEP
jgi:hypothetical protein